MKRKRPNPNLKAINRRMESTPKPKTVATTNKMPVWELKQWDSKETSSEVSTVGRGSPSIPVLNNRQSPNTVAMSGSSKGPVWELKQPAVRELHEIPLVPQAASSLQPTKTECNQPEKEVEYKPTLPFHLQFKSKPKPETTSALPEPAPLFRLESPTEEIEESTAEKEQLKQQPELWKPITSKPEASEPQPSKEFSKSKPSSSKLSETSKLQSSKSQPSKSNDSKKQGSKSQSSKSESSKTQTSKLQHSKSQPSKSESKSEPVKPQAGKSIPIKDSTQEQAINAQPQPVPNPIQLNLLQQNSMQMQQMQPNSMQMQPNPMQLQQMQSNSFQMQTNPMQMQSNPMIMQQMQFNSMQQNSMQMQLNPMQQMQSNPMQMQQFQFPQQQPMQFTQQQPMQMTMQQYPMMQQPLQMPMQYTPMPVPQPVPPPTLQQNTFSQTISNPMTPQIPFTMPQTTSFPTPQPIPHPTQITQSIPHPIPHPMSTTPNSTPQPIQNSIQQPIQNSTSQPMPLSTQTTPSLSQTQTTTPQPKMIPQSQIIQSNQSQPKPAMSIQDILAAVVAKDKLTTSTNAWDTGKEKKDTQQQKKTEMLFLPGAKRPSAEKQPSVERDKKSKSTTKNSKKHKDDVDKDLPRTSKFTPVHLREDMETSIDPIVMRYLIFWPWKNKVPIKETATYRASKPQMIGEEEVMEDIYSDMGQFLQVTVSPHNADRPETVLDALLDSVRGRSFIPCFVEFTEDECKFLVIRCKTALLAIHKYGFVLNRSTSPMIVTISKVDITTDTLDFIPKNILKKILTSRYNDQSLNLSKFTIGDDIKHFIYYPLNRISNQTELFQIEPSFSWGNITHLNLSRNRITSLSGFILPRMMPQLQHLDISYNNLDKLACLIPCKGLSLKYIWLEGNPLCLDYIDSQLYVKVLRMLFPTLRTIDDIHISLKGELPKPLKTYCTDDAKHVAYGFIQTFFPLLDAPLDQRQNIQHLYHEKVVLNVSFNQVLRRSRVCGRVCPRAGSLSSRARVVEQLSVWPRLRHDTLTFALDVILHTEQTTILRVSGVVKLTSDSLADDEEMIYFTRSVVLNTQDGVQYKITNEMLYWDELTVETARNAFKVTEVLPAAPVNLNMSAPDEDSKTTVIDIFMSITRLERQPSERCLDLKNWNLKTALQYFMYLYKNDKLDVIKK